jgi:galactokinase
MNKNQTARENYNARVKRLTATVKKIQQKQQKVTK